MVKERVWERQDLVCIATRSRYHHNRISRIEHGISPPPPLLPHASNPILHVPPTPTPPDMPLIALYMPLHVQLPPAHLSLPLPLRDPASSPFPSTWLSLRPIPPSRLLLPPIPSTKRSHLHSIHPISSIPTFSLLSSLR